MRGARPTVSPHQKRSQAAWDPSRPHPPLGDDRLIVTGDYREMGYRACRKALSISGGCSTWKSLLRCALTITEF
jgi:hypothetical protein